jgi:circadian clock protein KaiB
MSFTTGRGMRDRTPSIGGPDADLYSLTLFVSGASDSSAQAIADVREMCDVHLSGRYELNVVDLHQDPALAAAHRVLATPTLVRDRSSASRTCVGDMSDHRRILSRLGLPRASAIAPGALDAAVRPVGS